MTNETTFLFSYELINKRINVNKRKRIRNRYGRQ